MAALDSQSPRRVFNGGLGALVWQIRVASRSVGLLLLTFQVFASTSQAALPKRLVLLLDGVSYRDVKALQAGVTYTNSHGRQLSRQGFHQGYFPASRMISTFPAASDVAWTDIFGNRPLPGYQRTYFSAATGSEIRQNGVTTSMEYELQMHWELESGTLRKFGYLRPQATFKHEVRELEKNFFQTRDGSENFYGLIRASDDAQHTSGDIFALLCFLDNELKKLCERYQASEGRKLELLILSDHGNNHAGAGKRLPIRAFLEDAGYRVTDGIHRAKDVVLPTVGIQCWVELHCAPPETETLAELLVDLKGVDCLTAQVFGHPHQFVLLNAKRERARIEWKPGQNSFRYTPEHGDPLGYQPVLEALARQHQFDADGFAPADAWMRETLTHRYPLAPERIVRGHTQAALNPAPILISLTNGYVHSSLVLKQLSSLIRLGGTHGSLDDLSSDGVLLSNFAPTVDTSTRRVAALYDGFKGLRNHRASENGAEWIYRDVQALTSVARCALDLCHPELPGDAPMLRIWTPHFASLDPEAPIEITLARTGRTLPARVRRGGPTPADTQEQRLTLNRALPLSVQSECERVYALPSQLVLEPQKSYRISGHARDLARIAPLFEFIFQTDCHGLPVVQ